MKSKILFILLFFFCSNSYAQKKSFQIYSTDTTLSQYISQFYSDKENDTCYSGIHFIKIKFSRKSVRVISLSGQLPNQFTERIKQLIEKFSASYFNTKFIDFCRKNKKTVVQPILFDIPLIAS
jgi:hypothetical protein